MSISTYTKSFNVKKTPQSQPIPGEKQVKNSAGGFVYEVNDWVKLDRFLILGTEGGSYYAKERDLTVKNAEAVLRCIKADGVKAVARIVEVSDKGLAPKNDQAIFALAAALKLGNDETKRAAREAVPAVCRTGTHIFQFAESIKAFGGWGRATARAIANWYNKQEADKLALNLLKYQERNGWSHKDLLAKSHAGSGAPSEAHQALFSYVVRDGDLSARKVERKSKTQTLSVGDYPTRSREALPRIVEGFEKVRASDLSSKEVAKLVTEYGLPREFLPTEHLNSVEVWEALLHSGKHGMPLTALTRNLGKMTSIGLIAPGSKAAKFVASRLQDGEALRHARMHPVQFLIASRVYGQGKGDKGSLTWSPVSPIRDALEEAFYASFKVAEPTGGSWMLAIDVSDSMTWSQVSGTGLTPREASAAMALVTANLEADYEIMAFDTGIKPTGITRHHRLAEACNIVGRMSHSGTNCSLPVLHALKKNLRVDTFVIYTDSETWAGDIHPSQALREYRQKTGINAKMIVNAMLANEFTIADPSDPGMLDVVGFSADTPQVMASFARG